MIVVRFVDQDWNSCLSQTVARALHLEVWRHRIQECEHNLLKRSSENSMVKMSFVTLEKKMLLG